MNLRQVHTLQELLWKYYSQLPHTRAQRDAIKVVYSDICVVARLNEDELDFAHIDEPEREYMNEFPRP